MDLLNEASVTTLSSRQTQVQVADLHPIATNINPQALRWPGISTEAEEKGGLYSYADSLPIGPTLDMVPLVSKDGSEIQLTAIATLTEFKGYEKPTNVVNVFVGGKEKSVSVPLPTIKIRQTKADVVVPSGCSLLLFNDETPPGESLSRDAGEIRKDLLVLVTPTVIDSFGNPLPKK